MFTVALHQASEGQRWYTSTAQLQLASLQFCKACRSVPTLYMTVDEGTPEHLWDHSASQQRRASREWRRVRRLTRVPIFRPRGVTRNLLIKSFSFTGTAFAGVDCGSRHVCAYSSTRRMIPVRFIGSGKRFLWVLLHGRLSSSRYILNSCLTARWTTPYSQLHCLRSISG